MLTDREHRTAGDAPPWVHLAYHGADKSANTDGKNQKQHADNLNDDGVVHAPGGAQMIHLGLYPGNITGEILLHSRLNEGDVGRHIGTRQPRETN